MDLEYTVTNQVIQKNNRSKPANLSQKYLRLSFTFTEDWNNLTKFALFRIGEDNYRSALDGDKVIVPSIVLKNKKFLFTLYGIDDDLRITTNMVRVDLLESGFVHEAIGDDELDDPNVVEEIYIAIDKKANTSDMTTALAGKSDVGHTHTKSDITDFPTNISSFNNDAGYLTEHQSLAGYYTKTEVDNLINSLDNKILLTGDKTIIEAEETLDFTVKTKSEGFPLIDETVELYNGEDMRVKLGEATTNSQGIAVYEYTGTGAGELKVKAKAGNLQSETYSLMDALLIDYAVTGNNKNTYWTYYSTRTTVGDTGTTVTGEIFIKDSPSTSLAICWSSDLMVEFDLLSVDDNKYCNLQLYDGTTACNYRLYNTGHVTVKNKVGDPIIVKLDGETVSPVTAGNDKVTGTYRIGLQLGNSTSLVFKDWMVYLI